MVFGDGDGELFNRFTISLDIIGHELTHGVTEDEAQLHYFFQSGALNESVSDVFGSLVKQYLLQQTADEADWLIGAGLFTENVNGVALRSMKAPGTAYVVVDSAALTPEESAELQGLVNRAHFFELPSSVGAPPRGAADYRQYTISIEDGERPHTVRLYDPVENPQLQQLIRFLQAKARDVRRGA
jgi:hypothetical protein